MVWEGSDLICLEHSSLPSFSIYFDVYVGAYPYVNVTLCLFSLATAGIILSRYYACHVCTPSRASMMTGLYPTSLGMQHSIVSGDHLYGLPLDVATMPQVMKNAGFNTLMLGKVS
jgi:arylsulfatase A-like enzyme